MHRTEDTYIIKLSYICRITNRIKKQTFPYEGLISEAGAESFRDAANRTEGMKPEKKQRDYTNATIFNHRGKQLVHFKAVYKG